MEVSLLRRWPALPVLDSRVLGMGGRAGDLWPRAGLDPGCLQRRVGFGVPGLFFGRGLGLAEGRRLTVRVGAIEGAPQGRIQPVGRAHEPSLGL